MCIVSVSIMNALSNQSSFSKNQLVFGFKQCFYSSDPPAAFDQSCSVTVENNFNAKLKKNFSNEKLNRE